MTLPEVSAALAGRRQPRAGPARTVHPWRGLACLVWLSGCLYVAPDPPFQRSAAHSGDSPHTIRVGRATRHYILHLPPGDVWSVARPLVLVLHGTGSSAQRMPGQTGFDDAADRRGLIVAYPDGTGRWPVARTWHTGRC